MSSELPAEIWAKSARRAGEPGESLHAHTGLVVARLAQLRQRLPRLAEAVDDPGLWWRVFWACVLHDAGKAAAPFQRTLRDPSARWGDRHEIASLAFLPWVLGEEDDRAWAGAAIASHHRDAAVIEERYPAGHPEDIDFERLFGGFSDETLEAMRRWLRAAPERWAREFGFEDDGAWRSPAMPDTLDGRRFRATDGPEAVVATLRAYRRLRRQLDRDDADSAANRQAVICRGLVLLADRLASAHAHRLETVIVPEVAHLLREAGGFTGARDYQRLTGEIAGSVVVSAPTGSGKTEAALWWAGTYQRADDHRRTLLYLLPYQASLNAMQQRLQKTLGAEVGLLHGRAVQALYRMLLHQGKDTEAAERIANRATNLARLQHPAVRVATPYQLLRAAYRLPGYEAQWATLHSALVVVDEVHAYDPSRLGLFLGLLGHLVQCWDVRVCALTATMPSWLRELLIERLGASTVSASAEDFRSFSRHELRLVPGDLEAALPAVAARVEQGEAVLVAANTVRGAQTAYDQLCDILGRERVRLLHSRFTANDRLAKEQELMNLVALGRTARTPLAVVATQTIEVSLNLDFDTIYSEPAPLEALAQRFGRVNRKGRLHRAPVHVLTAPDDGQGVYDRRLVSATLTALAERDGQPLDEAELDRMLDAVYGGGLAEEYRDEVLRHEREFAASCLADLRAFQSDDELEEKFDSLFDGAEVVPAVHEEEFTRLVTDTPLEAQGLLVPISFRQLTRLRRADRVRPLVHGFLAADVPYDRDRGLRLDDETQ